MKKYFRDFYGCTASLRTRYDGLMAYAGVDTAIRAAVFTAAYKNTALVAGKSKEAPVKGSRKSI